MKKVLFVATVDSHIESFHLPYLKLLHDKGYEVHVATNGPNQFSNCDIKHQISLERNPFKIKNLIAIKQLKKIIKKEKYTLIHCHTPMGGVVARLAAKPFNKSQSKKGLKRTRVIYTAHGFHFYHGAPLLNWLLFYPVEKHLAKYTDTLITINQEDFNLATKKFERRCKNIEYIPGVGIDPKKFNFKMSPSEKHNLRKSLGLKDDDFVMIFPARLDKNKNQEMLIKVMATLSKKNPKIHLLLPGKDPYNNHIYKLIKKYNLQKHVHILGFRKDIPQLLKISDIAVSSSLREGLPVNLIEAMYSGLPIVATNCRGQRELITNGVNGFLTQTKDTNRFCECVNIVIESKEIRKKLINTNKLLMRKYSSESILQRISSVYFRKNKILHILNSNSYSGAENVACNIIETFNEEYESYYCSPHGDIESIVKGKNINYIPLNKFSYFEIKKILNTIRPNIVHAHDFKASILTALFGHEFYKISQIHQNPLWISKICLKTLILKILSHRIDKFIFVSKKIQKDYIFASNIQEKAIIINNCVSQDKIIELSKEKYSKKFDACFFGRLEDVKNPQQFIDIILQVKNKFPSVKACFLGDGNLRKEIVKNIEKYNLNDNLFILGFHENPYKIIKNCNCCINTSRYEGISMSAIESLILGIPVFSRNISSFEELFGTHKEFLCNSTDSFAKSIESLLKNKEAIELPDISSFTDSESWRLKYKKIYSKVIES